MFVFVWFTQFLEVMVTNIIKTISDMGNRKNPLRISPLMPFELITTP